jgi:hypothetical protein
MADHCSVISDTFGLLYVICTSLAGRSGLGHTASIKVKLVQANALPQHS